MKVAVQVNRGTGLPDDTLHLAVSLLRPDGGVVAADRVTTTAGARGQPQQDRMYSGELADPKREMESLKLEVFADGGISVGHVVVDVGTLEQLNERTVTLTLQRGGALAGADTYGALTLDAVGKLEVCWSVPPEFFTEFEEYEEYEESIEEEEDEAHDNESYDVNRVDESGTSSPMVEDEDEDTADEQLNITHLPLDTFMVKRDEVTVMKVCSKVLVVGTLAGYVHVLDFSGAVIQRFDPTPDGEHINDLDVDDDGNFVGSCSRGGKVRISSVCGDRSKLEFMQTFDQPIQAMALDPRYEQSPRFIIGGLQDKITLVEHNGFALFKKKWSTTVLYKKTGRIHAIRWRDNLVAWADESSVKVFDIEKRAKIVSVGVKSEVAPHTLSLYRCTLCWESGSTLIVAWANLLAICEIRQRPAYEMLRDDGGPDKKGYVKTFVSEDYFLCGVAPYGKRLLLLVYPDDLTRRPNGQPAPKPEMRILERQYGPNNLLSNVVEINRNQVKMQGFESMVPSGYQLAWDEKESEAGNIYIVSPIEIVIGKQCNVNERILWMLEKKRFEKAVREVTTQAQKHGGFGGITDETREAVLQALFDGEHYKRAAELMPRYLGTDVAKWIRWVNKYYEASQFAHIVDVIPVDRELDLGHDVYELVLQYFLWDADSTDGPKGFYLRVRKWPKDLYRPREIIAMATKRLERLPKPDALDPPPEEEGVNTMASPARKEPLGGVCDDPYTMVALGLAMLYEHVKDNAKALSMHLELGRSDVFEFIDRHRLHKVVLPHVVRLLWKNPELTLMMLKQHHEVLRPKDVVQRLRSRPSYLLKYLHELYRSGSRVASDYHEDLVKLYARYNPRLLYPFAKDIRNFEGTALSLERFDEICEARLGEDTPTDPEVRKDIYRSRALVLGRRGERGRALELLIKHVQCVKESVEFIAANNDDMLFQTLVNSCFEGGEVFVGELLDLLGDPEDPKQPIFIEPLPVLQRISDNMEIEDLKQRTRSILTDKAMKQFLRVSTSNIMQKDVCGQQRALVRKSNRAVRVRVGTESCCACDNAVRLRQNAPQGVVAFLCGHQFHQTCYLAALERAAHGGEGQFRGEMPPPLPATRVRYARLRDDKKSRRVAIAVGDSRATYPGAKLHANDRLPLCPFCTLKPEAPRRENSASPRGGGGSGGLPRKPSRAPAAFTRQSPEHAGSGARW